MNDLLLKADRKSNNNIVTITDNLPKGSVSISLDVVDKNGFSVRYGRIFLLEDFSESNIRDMLDHISIYFQGHGVEKLSNNVIDSCKRKGLLDV